MDNLEIIKDREAEILRLRTAETNSSYELQKIREHWRIPKEEYSVFSWLIRNLIRRNK